MSPRPSVPASPPRPVHGAQRQELLVKAPPCTAQAANAGKRDPNARRVAVCPKHRYPGGFSRLAPDALQMASSRAMCASVLTRERGAARKRWQFRNGGPIEHTVPTDLGDKVSCGCPPFSASLSPPPPWAGSVSPGVAHVGVWGRGGGPPRPSFAPHETARLLGLHPRPRACGLVPCSRRVLAPRRRPYGKYGS